MIITVNANLAVHGAPPAPRDHLRIFGAQATLELEGSRLSATGLVRREEEFDADTVYQEAYDATIAHFLDGLDGRVKMETVPDDNMKTLALVEEIYRRSRFDAQRKPR